MNWLVVLVAAGVAFGVTMMVVSIIEKRMAKRWEALEWRVRRVEEAVLWSGDFGVAPSNDKKGLSPDPTMNGGSNRLRAGWRKGRCQQGL